MMTAMARLARMLPSRENRRVLIALFAYLGLLLPALLPFGASPTHSVIGGVAPHVRGLRVAGKQGGGEHEREARSASARKGDWPDSSHAQTDNLAPAVFKWARPTRTGGSTVQSVAEKGGIKQPQGALAATFREARARVRRLATGWDLPLNSAQLF